MLVEADGIKSSNNRSQLAAEAASGHAKSKLRDSAHHLRPLEIHALAWPIQALPIATYSRGALTGCRRSSAGPAVGPRQHLCQLLGSKQGRLR